MFIFWHLFNREFQALSDEFLIPLFEDAITLLSNAAGFRTISRTFSRFYQRSTFGEKVDSLILNHRRIVDSQNRRSGDCVRKFILGKPIMERRRKKNTSIQSRDEQNLRKTILRYFTDIRVDKKNFLGIRFLYIIIISYVLMFFRYFINSVAPGYTV